MELMTQGGKGVRVRNEESSTREYYGTQLGAVRHGMVSSSSVEQLRAKPMTTHLPSHINARRQNKIVSLSHTNLPTLSEAKKEITPKTVSLRCKATANQKISASLSV